MRKILKMYIFVILIFFLNINCKFIYIVKKSYCEIYIVNLFIRVKIVICVEIFKNLEKNNNLKIFLIE